MFSQAAGKPVIGVVERITPVEPERVSWLMTDLKRLGIRDMRIDIDHEFLASRYGSKWYAEIVARFSREIRTLPGFTCPVPDTNGLRSPRAMERAIRRYAGFLERLDVLAGDRFEWAGIFLPAFHPGTSGYSFDAISDLLYRIHRLGRKTVLGGGYPEFAEMLDALCRGGAAGLFDAVGVNWFPAVTERNGRTWDDVRGNVRAVLANHDIRADIWITETGFPTWNHGEYRQLVEYARLTDVPVPRIYWRSVYDRPVFNGGIEDERFSLCGLKCRDGRPKLLFRILAEGGIPGVREIAALGNGSDGIRDIVRSGGNGHSGVFSRREPVHLITGGAGFIGASLADRLLSEGERVMVFDNLSRPGVERNLLWLRDRFGDGIRSEIADIRDHKALRSAIRSAKSVFHFAAQVAVTSSLDDPEEDFEVNARGTLNLLESIREMKNPPPLVFTSTNKVYGCLDDLPLRRSGNRYEPEDPVFRHAGISERRPLDFHSPYGCSKGTADQYVRDYARIFGIPTVVFRMSCIYGPRQLGTEDQGWVAHFLISALRDEPITLYGDGAQVRDILFIDDLVDAFLLARKQISSLAGETFNIGGGPVNAVSLMDVLDVVRELHGGLPEVRSGGWRTGDQRYYVSDTGKFSAATGWTPKIEARTGIARSYRWLAENLPGVSSSAESDKRVPEPVTVETE